MKANSRKVRPGGPPLQVFSGPIAPVVIDVEAAGFPYEKTDRYLGTGGTIQPTPPEHILGVGILDATGRYAFLGGASLRQAMSDLSAQQTPFAFAGHNLSYDMQILALNGILLPSERLLDTYLGARLLWPGTPCGLKELARTHLGSKSPRAAAVQAELKQARREARKWGIKARNVGFGQIASDTLKEYNHEDCLHTMELLFLINGGLRKTGLDTLWLDACLALRITGDMTKQGVCIDKDYLERQERVVQAAQDQVADRLNRYAKEALGHPQFSVSRNAQVRDVLISSGIPDFLMQRNGRPCVAAPLLRRLMSPRLAGELPVMSDVLTWRQKQKLRTTYYKGLQNACVPSHTGGDYLHPDWRVDGAATGRMACRKPNLQNVKEDPELRKAFTMPAGMLLLCVDYSQVELRWLALESGDPCIVQAYQEGRDLHDETVQDIILPQFPELDAKMARKRAKVVNFGILYGEQDAALAATLNCSVEAARRIRQRWFDKFAGVRYLKEKLETDYRQAGYVTDAWGRRYVVRSGQEHKLLNAVIQGGCANLLRHVLPCVSQHIHEAGGRVAMVIHDEICSYVPLNTRISPLVDRQVIPVMTTLPFTAPVTLKAEASVAYPTWADKEALDDWLAHAPR